jgi:hypothetical protein
MRTAWRACDMKRNELRGHRSWLAMTVVALASCGDTGAPGSAAFPSKDASGDSSLEAAVLEAQAETESPPAPETGEEMPDSGIDVSFESSAAMAPQTCADLARLVCGSVQTCAPFWLTINFGDSTTCVSRLNDVCNHAEGAGTPFDKAGCAQALAAPYCHAVLSADFERGGIPDVCGHPRDDRAANASCGSFSECRSLSCAFQGGGLCGTCAGEAGRAHLATARPAADRISCATSPRARSPWRQALRAIRDPR